MKAVLIGAGRIGCGFAGLSLAAAGYDLTFVGRGEIVEHLERARAYRVRLLCGARASEDEVIGVRALHGDDPRAIDALASADLIGVSVGTASLAAVGRRLWSWRQEPGPSLRAAA